MLRREVEAFGAEHISWKRALHRKTRSLETLFIDDWGPTGFGAMRDNLAVGPAAAFAADVREELERRPRMRSLPALNAARVEQGLPPLAHVLDQGRSVARVLIMSSPAFDLVDRCLPRSNTLAPVSTT